MPRATLKQRKDGRYACRYDGKFFYGKNQTEAYAARDEYKRNKERGLREEARGKTVTQYAGEWMLTYKSSVAPKAYNGYLRFINDLIDECGQKVLMDVTTSDIQRVYNKRAGKSGSNIKKQAMTINSLFEAALADGLILRNPCAKAKRQEGADGSHRALEPWEKEVVEGMASTDHRFATAALVMLYAGLRRGEVLALNIDRDVDFRAKKIYVREAISFDDNNHSFLGDPKSEAGIRSIPLLIALENALKGKRGLIVSNEKGEYLTPSAFRSLWDSYVYRCEEYANGGRRRRWYGLTKEDLSVVERGEKLPPWRDFHIQTHDFRHTYCTMLYEAGVDLKSAQKWMGHADEKMILKIYAHLSEKQENRAIESLRVWMGETTN